MSPVLSTSSDMNREEVLKILNNNNLLPESKFGQNFLCDENIISDIISCSGIKAGDRVLEIGPGLGALTRPLSEMDINLTVVEIDKRIVSYLSSLDLDAEIISSDYLKLKDYQEDSFDIAISNIPYYVTTPIIKKLIEDLSSCRRMTFMVEDDALQRIMAKPKTKQYGPLAVIMNAFGSIRKEFTVPGNCFYPAPNTLSSVITLERSGNNVIDPSFTDFVTLCFNQRRKKLLNNLSTYGKETVLAAIEKTGLSADCRAEELSFDLFLKLYNDIINS